MDAEDREGDQRRRASLPAMKTSGNVTESATETTMKGARATKVPELRANVCR